MGITNLMKFITLKKNLPKYTILSIIILLTITNSINCNTNTIKNPTEISKESKEESLCKLESIHIPMGSSLPIMTYGAAAVGGKKKKYRITVLEKDDVDEFNVE